jgi:predicted protein tyrosine phosphatase
MELSQAARARTFAAEGLALPPDANPSIVILGYSEAAMFLRREPTPVLAGLISIHAGREFGVEAEAPRRLDLTFDDVDVPDNTDLEALQCAMGRKRWAEQNGLFEVPPTSSDARAIIDFAESLRGTSDLLLCHCGGGMSRAPAAGLICLAVWAGPGREVECVERVSNLRRGAVPHAGLIRFADTLLGRGGKLLDAVSTRRR